MPYQYHIQAHLTYQDIRVDEVHNTCEAAARAGWEFVWNYGDPPGWMLSRWLRTPDGNEAWDTAFIQGFSKDVAEKGFFKLTHGSSVYGENYCQITRMEVEGNAKSSKF